jgi:hypothetical protein
MTLHAPAYLRKLKKKLSPWLLAWKVAILTKGVANSHENMDTLEVAALPPGSDPLVTRFSKSANPKAMLDLVGGEYNQDLLSRRLQGNAVKEGLAITLLSF